MEKITVIYDDSRIPVQEIRDITGKKNFGSTIFKRVSLKERMKETALSMKRVGDFVCDTEWSMEAGAVKSEGKTYFVIFSDFVVKDSKALSILLEKSCYAKDAYKVVNDERISAMILPDADALRMYLKNDTEGMFAIEDEAFMDISTPDAFRQYITSGFDARFFNALSGDEYTVVKSSKNVAKIKAEYDFYHMLPDEMKTYFTLPYNYREEDGAASYTMERYHMTDLAIRYVHGAIDKQEFTTVLKRLFMFIEKRTVRQVSAKEYEINARALYVDKVNERIEMLKQNPQYERLNRLISEGTAYNGIDDVVSRYMRLYDAITAKKDFAKVLVISHGDLCFSNILYSPETSLLRLIDPKGATQESDLYMNPYYDIAKLSHSICGRYDFFNSDLFEISLNNDMKFKLIVDGDTSEYVEIFKMFLAEKGIDYRLVRLYEASLFISMLPLHIDREKKTFGLLLNAINILEELEV